ncbi:hypothetical protein ACH5RR_014077 [Cinchona calisaya]|uniref:Uncharacterized protein n=1 Tax=Cinchona calisaya TaxID=153742 RepID=A0ABD3A595_9GENT
MAPKCSILASLFVVLIVSQSLQIIEGRKLLFRRPKSPMEKSIILSNGQYGLSKTNQMNNVVPTELMETAPPGPPPAPPASVEVRQVMLINLDPQHQVIALGWIFIQN